MSQVASTMPEQELWQAVLFAAFVDATRVDPPDTENRRAKRDADRWIRGAGKDFRTVCALAGMDPDFLRDAYVTGRVCPERLRNGERSHKAKAVIA